MRFCFQEFLTGNGIEADEHMAEVQQIPENNSQTEDDVELQENHFSESVPEGYVENKADSENSDGFVIIKSELNDGEAEGDAYSDNECLSYAEIVKTSPRSPNLENCSVELDDHVTYRTEILDDATFGKMSSTEDAFSPATEKIQEFTENVDDDSVGEETELEGEALANLADRVIVDWEDVNTSVPACESEHCLTEASTDEQQNFPPNGEDKAENYMDNDGYKTIRKRRNRKNKKNKGRRHSSATENFEAEPLSELQENVLENSSFNRRKNSRRVKNSPKKQLRGSAESYDDSAQFFTNPVWKSYYLDD